MRDEKNSAPGDWQPKGLFSVRALAEHLGVSKSTIYAWTAAGILAPPLRIGPRAVRFSPEAVAAFLAERREATAKTRS